MLRRPIAKRCQPKLWRPEGVGPPVRSLPARELPAVQRGPAQQVQECRGESGWCSDMTSTHGVWRHTGVRFLLSGAAAVLPSAARRRQPPCHSVGLRNHRADLSWRGDTQVLDSSSPGCCRAARASVRGWQQKPCSCVPIADVQSVLMACTAARSQPKLGCPGGLARLRGRCLFGSCPLSSVPRRSKLKNAGVSRAGART